MLGFERRWVDHALALSLGDGNKALEWLLSPAYEKAVRDEAAKRARAAQLLVNSKKSSGGEGEPGPSAPAPPVAHSIYPAMPPPVNPEWASHDMLPQMEGAPKAPVNVRIIPKGGQPAPPSLALSTKQDSLTVDDRRDFFSTRSKRQASSRRKPSMVPEYRIATPSSTKKRPRVGLPVLVFSQGLQDWVPGKINKMKDKLVLIVYGESQKWLPIESNIWRPIFDEDEEKEAAAAPALMRPKTPDRVYKKQNNDKELIFKKGNPDMDIITDQTGKNAYVGKIRHKGTRKLLKEGSMVILIKQQYVENLRIEEILMELAKCPIGQPLPMVFREVQNPKFKDLYPGDTEQDYEVVFTDNFLGLELKARDPEAKTGALVKKRHTDHAKSAVSKEAWVTSVNNRWVCGHPYEVIKKTLQNALQTPPVVLTFRAPIEKQYGPKERGLLLIRVVCALNLKSSANYCQVDVGETKLCTRSKSKSQNIEWQEKLAFKNFRPNLGKKAVITVLESRSLLKDNAIGTCEFEIPTRFSSMKRETLELKNKKGGVTGLIVLHSIVNKTGSWR